MKDTNQLIGIEGRLTYGFLSEFVGFFIMTGGTFLGIEKSYICIPLLLISCFFFTQKKRIKGNIKGLYADIINLIFSIGIISFCIYFYRSFSFSYDFIFYILFSFAFVLIPDILEGEIDGQPNIPKNIGFSSMYAYIYLFSSILKSSKYGVIEILIYIPLYFSVLHYIFIRFKISNFYFLILIPIFMIIFDGVGKSLSKNSEALKNKNVEVVKVKENDKTSDTIKIVKNNTKFSVPKINLKNSVKEEISKGIIALLFLFISIPLKSRIESFLKKTEKTENGSKYKELWFVIPTLIVLIFLLYMIN